MKVVVVPTGIANLASVLAGLRRAGGDPRLAADAGEVEVAERVLLPGVGAFGPGMARLREGRFDQALAARVAAGRPLLAICLGLQLLCEASEEDPGVAGLGLVAGRVERFTGAVRVPQMGWNRVEPAPACRLLEPGHAYFANSYRLVAPPPGTAAALSDHGGPLVAAFERGPLLACQFHPELSGPWGTALLRRWLEAPSC